MRCEWCCDRREAEWWGDTIYGAEAAMCTRHRDMICAKDEAGAFACVPAAEREKQEQPEEGR